MKTDEKYAKNDWTNGCRHMEVQLHLHLNWKLAPPSPHPAIPPLSSKVKWLKEKEEQEKIDHKGGVLIQQKEGYQPGFFPTDLITKERARFQLGQAAVVMDRPTQLRDLLSVYTDRLKDCLYKEKRGIETLNLQEELREMKNIFSFIFFSLFPPLLFGDGWRNSNKKKAPRRDAQVEVIG